MSLPLTEDQQIASTILQQLGGRQFLVMTGAKRLTTGQRALSVSINSINYERKRVNLVRIRLDWNDTYTVDACYFTKKSCKLVATQSDVYCDQLQDTFEALTGMLVTLFPRR